MPVEGVLATFSVLVVDNLVVIFLVGLLHWMSLYCTHHFLFLLLLFLHIPAIPFFPHLLLLKSTEMETLSRFGFLGWVFLTHRTSDQCLVMGNFNSVLSPTEKQGGSRPGI